MTRRASLRLPWTYAVTLAVLLVLTAATVGAAGLDLGRWSDLVAAAIATLKALLVVVVFMHARREPRVVPMVITAAVLWLLILFGLTLADYVTRPGP